MSGSDPRPGHREGAPSLLAVVGPTGIGKTALAVALAALAPLEAVSVDSRQVYRGMDVGTGKPGPAERRALLHHLLDVAEPDERYDVARFVREADRAIADIRARGRLPVLVGGTGLYYRALTRGLRPSPPADLALRGQVAREGPGAAHRRLQALDPTAAARLHPRDTIRVIRALEVRLGGGPALASGALPWAAAPPRYAVTTIGLTMARPALYARLDARVERMLGEGLLAEVEGLLAAGFGPDLPAMHGIGYRHLTPVLTGAVRFHEAVDAMKRDTRRYAKRQRTWFEREPDVHWLGVDPAAPERTLAEAEKLLGNSLLFDYTGR